jgi:hypothetical protein
MTRQPFWKRLTPLSAVSLIEGIEVSGSDAVFGVPLGSLGERQRQETDGRQGRRPLREFGGGLVRRIRVTGTTHPAALPSRSPNSPLSPAPRAASRRPFSLPSARRLQGLLHAVESTTPRATVSILSERSPSYSRRRFSLHSLCRCWPR